MILVFKNSSNIYDIIPTLTFFLTNATLLGDTNMEDVILLKSLFFIKFVGIVIS